MTIMTEKDRRETVAAAKALRDEVGDSKEKAVAVLVRLGLITPNGELTENYK